MTKLTSLVYEDQKDGSALYRDERPGGYGDIGRVRYTSGGAWVIEIENNCIGFRYPAELQSLEAAGYILLAFALELEATGH